MFFLFLLFKATNRKSKHKNGCSDPFTGSWVWVGSHSNLGSAAVKKAGLSSSVDCLLFWSYCASELPVMARLALRYIQLTVQMPRGVSHSTILLRSSSNSVCEVIIGILSFFAYLIVIKSEAVQDFCFNFPNFKGR